MPISPSDSPITRTETLSFQLRHDGIMHVISRPGSPQTPDDAVANIEIARTITGGKRVPVLLDIRDTGALSREARLVYIGERGVDTVIALAIVADSAFSRVVGNIFIRLARTKYPVKLFTSEDAAAVWLGENA